MVDRSDKRGAGVDPLDPHGLLGPVETPKEEPVDKGVDLDSFITNDDGSLSESKDQKPDEGKTTWGFAAKKRPEAPQFSSPRSTPAPVSAPKPRDASQMPSIISGFNNTDHESDLDRESTQVNDVAQGVNGNNQDDHPTGEIPVQQEAWSDAVSAQKIPVVDNDFSTELMDYPDDAEGHIGEDSPPEFVPYQVYKDLEDEHHKLDAEWTEIMNQNEANAVQLSEQNEELRKSRKWMWICVGLGAAIVFATVSTITYNVITERDSALAERDAAAGDLNEVNELLGESASTVEEKDQRIADLEDSLRNLSGRVGEANNRANDLQSELDGVQGQIADRDGRIRELENQNSRPAETVTETVERPGPTATETVEVPGPVTTETVEVPGPTTTVTQPPANGGGNGNAEG